MRLTHDRLRTEVRPVPTNIAFNLQDTLVGEVFNTPDPRVTYGGVGGLAWVNRTSSGSNWRVVNVYNFGLQSTTILEKSFASGHIVKGLVDEFNFPPGRAILTTGSNTIVRLEIGGQTTTMTFSGIPSFNSHTFIQVNNTLESSTEYWAAVNIGTTIDLGLIGLFDTANATFTLQGLSGVNLLHNSNVLDLRQYFVRTVAGVYKLSWIQTITKVVTDIVTFANPVSEGVMTSGPIYIQSGATNDADKINAYDTDGNLGFQIPMDGFSSTAYGTVRHIIPSTNNYLWVADTNKLYLLDVVTRDTILTFDLKVTGTQVYYPLDYHYTSNSGRGVYPGPMAIRRGDGNPANTLTEIGYFTAE